MKFRSVILAAVMALVIGVVAISVVTVTAVLERSTRAELAEALDRSAAVFADLQSYRRSLFDAEARMTAQEPRVKAVVAAEDVSHETILDVAQEIQTTLGSDLLVFTDGEGILLADTADPKATGFDMSRMPLIASALESGQASDVWVHEDGVTQVHARNMAFGSTSVGVLVVGHDLDARVVETVHRQTGSGAVLLLDGKVIAASAIPGSGAGDEAGAEGGAPPELADAVRGLTRGEAAPMVLSGSQYLARIEGLPGYTGKHQLEVVVLRSLDEALATSRDLSQRLYIIAAVALLIAALIAVVVAGRLARPIDELVGFTREIGEGKLVPRPATTGPVEIRALGTAMNEMVRELDDARQQIAAKERLEREMEIAERIQTSILPPSITVSGLEVAARMVPADEVGGDYYDVLPTEDGCWIGVGDVAGHGLPAGLVMLMVQSATSVLTYASPNAQPSELVDKLNRTLFENVRKRLLQDEHVTFTLLRYHEDGRFVYAGAHEEMVICRRSGEVETVATPGTWLAARADITAAIEDLELRLQPGDVMLLYTDGMIEGANDEQEQYGLDRLRDVVAAARDEPVEAILDKLFGAVDGWAPKYDDDRTAMVIRYRGPSA